jgi:hypothetical protein
MQKTNYAPITPKTSYYRTDGTGRDTYISFDNGGAFARMTAHAAAAIPRVGSATVRPKSAVSGARSLHYYSDGSGRDKYIKLGDGGLHLDYPDVCASHQFVASLRASTPSAGRTIRPGDVFEWAQRSWTPQRARQASREKKRVTDDCTRRLTGFKARSALRLN